MPPSPRAITGPNASSRRMPTRSSLSCGTHSSTSTPSVDASRAAVDDAVEGGAGGGRVAHVQLHEAAVALVLDVRTEAFEHGRPPERAQGVGGLLRGARGGAERCGDLVGREEGFGLAFVEGRATGVQSLLDEEISGRPAAGQPPVTGSDGLWTSGLVRIRSGGPPAVR